MSNISALKIDATPPKEILDLLIQIMTNAEDLKPVGAMKGQLKKEYVLKMLDKLVFIEPNVRELLVELIDIIILLDKNKLKIKNAVSGCCTIC
jgi:hypothetical protein